MPDLDHLRELSRILSVSIDVLLDLRPDEARGLIGIDGGGTKTEFTLIDEDGRNLNSIVLEGSNPNIIGMEKAVDVVRRGIDFLRPGEMKVMGIFFGGAGMNSGNNTDVMKIALSKAYPDIKVECANDIANVIACCSHVASFSPLVSTAAKQGDSVAWEILRCGTYGAGNPSGQEVCANG